MAYSFIKAGAKHLSSVEIDSLCSNQHEFNGVSSLKTIFGNKKQRFSATFIYYDEEGEDSKEYGTLTWYDAREANPLRTEYRLYYSDNNIVNLANTNDLLIVGKREDNTIVVIIAKNSCSYYHMFMQLFGLRNFTSSYVIANSVNM